MLAVTGLDPAFLAFAVGGSLSIILVGTTLMLRRRMSGGRTPETESTIFSVYERNASRSRGGSSAISSSSV
ncbi:hypothetical protein CQ040_20330 [Microbacterium sp. MYb54]|nr:hypothetical protein CQ032_20280 [Microbacterium sp. MYb43]PQZ68890.1 hypothetical protein CQ031_20260 [Microbacterium sp. MYb40]PRB13735.1 hypothetical protein CQ040_20330 [Microbacterium sp. MYb54]PRB19723.1 hypothetical protein CQ037_20280 [Microbacterium sp. MYb50]PRB57323.1 hypothetical protein CQ021_20330 [Microbacterium sp. MYb24]PRB64274.1 hypothetical protein CQ027_20260 [Microbacterium sp. MYb32]